MRPHIILCLSLLAISVEVSAAASGPDSTAARALIRRAVLAAPPLSDLLDTLPAWPGSEEAISGKSFESLLLWSRVIPLQWTLGDTAEARSNAEILCRWGSRDRDSGHPCDWLLSNLRRAGDDGLAHDLITIAIEGLEGQKINRRRLLHEMVGALAEIDTTAAIAFVMEEPSDSLRENRFFKLANEHTADPQARLALIAHVEDPELRATFFHNLAFRSSHRGDWATAQCATDSLPDTHYTKPLLLAMVAAAQQQAGEAARAESTVDRVLQYFATDTASVDEGDKILDSIARTLVKLGAFDRAESLLSVAPEWSRRSILLEKATSLARRGLPDSALTVFGAARLLKPRYSHQHLDDGLVDWIAGIAESTSAELAESACADLHYGFSKGQALGEIARARAERGVIDDARRIMGSITNCPDGVSEAMVAIAAAEARAGRLEDALETLDEMTRALEQQCREPMDRPPSSFGNRDPCPPEELIRYSRHKCLLLIAATPVGRASVDRLVQGLSRLMQAEVLTKAASSFLAS